MPSQAITALWTSWGELWNGNLGLVDKIIAPDFVAHFAPVGTSPSEVRGPAGLAQWIGGMRAGFTDAGFTTVVGPLAENDLVAGRWIFRGIYQGGMPGSSPAAAGKRVEYAGMDLFRVRDGKIVEYWLCADMLQLLQQLGVIPS